MPKTMWVVRAGQDAVYIHEFLQRKLVAIGWGETGDLTAIHSRDAIAQLLKQYFPDYTPRQNAVNTGQVFRFREELCVGSTLLTYDLGTRTYHISAITGEYKYRPDLSDGLQHTKPVHWMAEIKRDDLTAETKNP